MLRVTASRSHPVWFMRQAGRYLPEYRSLRSRVGSFWEICQRPDLAAEVSLQPLARFDLDAAIVFSDILVIAKALGVEVNFTENGLQLSEVRSLADLKTDPDLKKRWYGPVYDALAMVKARLGAGKSLIGFAGAPWTLACYMTSGANARDRTLAAKHWAYSDPKGFSAFLRLLSDEIATHLIAQIRAGADTVQIFDSLAGGLPDALFAPAILYPTQYIVGLIRSSIPDAHIIGFPRQANLQQYLQYGHKTGVDVVSLDTSVSMDWAVSEMGGKAVQGNLDPAVLLTGGEPLRASVSAILKSAAGYPLIFNLGHGVLPETPVAHVAEVIGMVKSDAAKI